MSPAAASPPIQVISSLLSVMPLHLRRSAIATYGRCLTHVGRESADRPGHVARISRVASTHNRCKTMCSMLLRCAHNWPVLCAIPVDSIRANPIYSWHWVSGLNGPSYTESADECDRVARAEGLRQERGSVLGLCRVEESGDACGVKAQAGARLAFAEAEVRLRSDAPAAEGARRARRLKDGSHGPAVLPARRRGPAQERTLRTGRRSGVPISEHRSTQFA